MAFQLKCGYGDFSLLKKGGFPAQGLLPEAEQGLGQSDHPLVSLHTQGRGDAPSARPGAAAARTLGGAASPCFPGEAPGGGRGWKTAGEDPSEAPGLCIPHVSGVTLGEAPVLTAAKGKAPGPLGKAPGPLPSHCPLARGAGLLEPGWGVALGSVRPCHPRPWASAVAWK